MAWGFNATGFKRPIRANSVNISEFGVDIGRDVNRAVGSDGRLNHRTGSIVAEFD